MQVIKVSALLSFFALALATPTPVQPRAPAGPASTPTNNAGRPVPNGACCVANTSLRQDVCKDASGASGRCVPSGSANCEPFRPPLQRPWNLLTSWNHRWWKSDLCCGHQAHLRSYPDGQGPRALQG